MAWSLWARSGVSTSTASRSTLSSIWLSRANLSSTPSSLAALARRSSSRSANAATVTSSSAAADRAILDATVAHTYDADSCLHGWLSTSRPCSDSMERISDPVSTPGAGWKTAAFMPRSSAAATLAS